MRVTIAAVGRAHAAPEQTICDLYLERANPMAKRLGFGKLELFIIDTSRARTAEARMEEEAQKLLKQAGSGHLIALDEQGKAVTSEIFAKELAKFRNRGQDIAFLI